MTDATHPGAYSVYWNPPAIRKPSGLTGLKVSLGILAVALTGSVIAVTSRFDKLPTPEQIAVIPPGAEGMNTYPVVETADIWLAPAAE